MEKTEMIKSCGQMCGDNRFELIDKIKEDIIRATNITKEETELLGNILVRLWQRHWLIDSNKIEELQAKAEAYDRLMSGGKKTLKELANIFGSIVAMDESGRLHLFGLEPKINKNVGEWQPAYRSYHERVPICDIDFNGDWENSLTMPDGWEEK